MKIPKALNNRVFNNGYSKHFRDLTSGTKLKKMIKEHVWKKKFFLKRIRIRQETDLKIPKALNNRVFNNGYSKHFRDLTSGTKLKKMIKEHVWKKKFFLKRIRIRQETDLKIPKALNNRVFNNGYSKHFRDLTSGTKLKKMIKEHVWKKKFFLKRIRIRQETDLKIPKALNNRVFNNGYSKHFRDLTSGTKLKKMIKEHIWKKKFFLKRIRIRQETDLKIPKALNNRVFNNGYSKHFRDLTSGTKLKKMIKEHVWKKKFFLKRIRIRQETDLKIPKALNNRVFNNGYSKHFRDLTSGTKLKKMIKEHVWKKKFFLKRIRIRQETDLKIPKALNNRVFNNGYSKHFRDLTSGTKLKKMIKEHVWKKKFFLKRIRIRQETDLKIPKALNNRVFNNGYSKHFRDLTSGQS